MRVCIVYDCLFPHTVGGAERWYRRLAERLAEDGHEVTYLTLRQWDRGEDPGVPGVEVRVVGPRMKLYDGPGHRRILPPLVFGAGVLAHLLRHGRRYDVVHTCAFPYFSLLAAALARRAGGYRLVVDWFEVWSRGYWREYLGQRAGDVGWLVQRLCARVPQRVFCFSRLYAARLREEGLRGEIVMLAGAYEGPLEPDPPAPTMPLVVFAGRHIPEKNVPALVPAIARARERIPELRATIFGDGPEREAVRRLVAEAGLEDVVDVPGFVATERVDETLGQAMCLLLPSRREGYGLVVVEAAAHGTPSIVVAGPDNAAVELIEEGVNGFVAGSTASENLAAAIVAVSEGGEALRNSTRAWFAAHAREVSLGRSLELALGVYDDRAEAGGMGGRRIGIGPQADRSANGHPRRFAIVGSPRSGNTWLRLMLVDACGIPDLVVHSADEFVWEELPGEFVLQLHARPTAQFRDRLARHRIRPIVLARHPLDVLISILQFASPEIESERWLGGEGGDESELVDAAPTDGAFLRYATGPRADALLSLTADWAACPESVCLRYEHLVRAPQEVLEDLLEANRQLAERIARSVHRYALPAIRASIGSRHVWQGRPGLWRSLLPAERASLIARHHERIMRALDYHCDPDDSLTPAAALALWRTLTADSATKG